MQKVIKNNTMKKDFEILAPCGSYESLVAAMRSGCDAVYIGSKEFSARHSAENFEFNEMKEGIRQCHKRKIKVYQAINTVVFDLEIEKLKEEIKTACVLGVDGIISQDMAVAILVKTCCPEMELHASTQMTIHSESGIEFARNMGFSRVVVARELSGDRMGEMNGTDIELEAFVHGALCMSVSGQCYMSAMIGSRSANRGRCAQPCRLPFRNTSTCEYALSLKDMSHVDYLDELRKKGVYSFKIEGRMKRPEYVAQAVQACYDKMTKNQYDQKSLRAVFSRSGFTDGYYTNQLTNMFGVRQKEDVTSAKDVFATIRNSYHKERKVTTIDFEIAIKKGMPIEMKAMDGDGNYVIVKADQPVEATSGEVSREKLEKQLRKLGDTIYEFGGLEATIDNGLWIPVSTMNDLRRQAICALDELRISKYTKNISFVDCANESIAKREEREKEIWCDFASAKYVSERILQEVEKVIIPAQDYEMCLPYDKDKIILSLPRWMDCESSHLHNLEKAKEAGYTKVMASNVAHILMAEKMGMDCYGDTTLNITNSLAIKGMTMLKMKAITVSIELKKGQINHLNSDIPKGIMAYGKLPLMMTKNCPISSKGVCKHKKCETINRKITDDTNRCFAIACKEGRDYVEVLNSETLYLADKMDEFIVDYMVLKFYEENEKEIMHVIRQYKERKKEEDKKYTRGLYYRGVL